MKSVSLSDNQKKSVATAYKKREIITLRLSKDDLTGNDVLYFPKTTVNRLEKNRKLNKGMDIKLAKTNIRKQVARGILSSLLPLARTLAPTIGKTLGLSALAGLASKGASQIVKSISGGEMHYFVSHENLHYLAKNQHLLNKNANQRCC